MSSIPPDAPGLAQADLDIARDAIGLELALRDLYGELFEAEGGDLWHLMREQHEAFATRIAGIAGVPADTADGAVVSQFQSSLMGDPAATALSIENTAAATHTSLVGQTTENPLASAMAAIAMIESRHAVAIAASTGSVADDDFTKLFDNPELGT